MDKKLKILLATDYSDAAISAEHYAFRLAKSLNANLSMLYIYDKQHISTSMPIEVAKIKRDYENFELEILKQHREKLYHSLNINEEDLKCACFVREGSIVTGICDEAEDWGANFIVVGTHGASGFRKIFFGTHAWEVIKKSSIPVLAIPKDGEYSEIKKIVFGTDQREGEISGLSFLVAVAKEFDAEITMLHVSNFSISKQVEEKMFTEFRDEVKGKVFYDKLSIHLAHYGDVADGLNDFCLRTKTDLLVVSPERHSLLEKIFVPTASLTKKLSFQTHVPLLVIPDYYNPEFSKVSEIYDLDERYLKEEF